MRIQPSAKGTRLLRQGRQRRIAYLAAHLGSVTRAELETMFQAVDILERLLRDWTPA